MQASTCLELRIPANLISETAFDALAAALDAMGQAEETDVDSKLCERIAWFDSNDQPDALRTRIEVAALLHGVGPEQIHLNSICQEHWETEWQKQWQALPVGQRLWVRPSFCEPPTDDRIDIVLDPGMAFGTGTHPTTQLCLEAIERICRDHPPATLLDMGAGSGLLAIAALKLGTLSAVAIDMEQESVDASLTNAAMNGVRLDARLDDTPPAAQFDLVVANILAAPLVWMATELAASVSNRLLLSGLLVEQVDDVAAAYIAQGLTERRRDQMGEWASVELTRTD